jgi:pentatricopeptide repeat protein
LRKRGCVPSLASYNHIVHGLAKNGGYLRAYQLFEQGIEIGYVPSEYMYKVLMDCLYSEEYDIRKAKQLLYVMLNKKGIDKTRIYNIYLQAVCQIKNDVSTELLNTLVIMLETNCYPDVVTLNMVINGFGKIGKVEEGIKVLDDSITHAIMITGLCECDLVDEAKVLWDDVIWPSGVHDNFVYSAIAKGLCH